VSKLLRLVEILTKIRASASFIETEGESCQSDLSPPVSKFNSIDNVARTASISTATCGGDYQPNAGAASQQQQTGGAES